MSNGGSIWSMIARAVQLYFYPLREAAQGGTARISALVQKALGSSDPGKLGTLTQLADTVSGFEADLSSVESPADVAAFLADLLTALEAASADLAADAGALLEYLTIQFLWNVDPRVYGILGILDVIDETKPPRDRLNWNNLKYLARPRELIHDVYRWGEDGFEGPRLLSRVANAAAAFNAPISYATVRENALGTIDPGSADVSSSRAMVLAAPLLNKVVASGYVSAGFTAFPVGGGTDPTNAGIAVVPFGVAGFPAEEVSPGWSVSFSARAFEGRGVAIRPKGITPFTLVAESGADVHIKGSIRRTAGQPWQQSFGGIFNLRANVIETTVEAALGDDPTFKLQLRVDDFDIRVTSGGSDGFLKAILPPEGIGAATDFTLGWTTDEGVRFSGSAELATSLPLHVLLGPVLLDTLHLIGRYDGPVIAIDALLDVGAQIGPISASITKIGVRLEFALDADAANDERFDHFGPVGVHLAPVPPTGVGIAVNAGGITGGGFVAHDEPSGRYAGILDLKFGEIGLVAVGLITTKLPNGRPGYALFVNIGVTFSPAITLPYNFNLRGCGGLLALNRTMDVEALRNGLRNRTLDSILFPENPILNANKIIADSERVFPIEEGRFVVGPMAKLGWGANGLIVADVAVVIELPAPIIIALLGQITAKVPNPNQAKIVIHLDILGVLDIAKKSLSIDATLYDSKIITYDLSGDAALRLTWGSDPVFGMSLGGWHPKFSPPANFPSLRRLKLQLSSSSSFDLSCTVYQALTSNTLQFGAGLSLHAQACGADVDGKLTMDTLICFSPFEFEVDISGKVSVRYKGHNVASVRLEVNLSGPTPWHAKGTAKFSVLFWDVSAHFNKTWGSDEKAVSPAYDPLPDFLREVREISNWNGAVLPRRTAVESLKSLAPVSGAKAPDLLMHPAGALEVRQRLLPLQFHLDTFANADVKDHHEFDITLSLGLSDPPANTPPVDVTGVEEHFARGQFQSLSKAERLSKPSYELFRAGVRAGPTVPRLDGATQACELEFESIVIKADGASGAFKTATPKWAALKRAINIAALRRAGLQRRGLGKFMNSGARRLRVQDEAYTVVDSTTFAPATTVLPPNGERLTQARAEALVTTATTAKLVAPGSVVVVPVYEATP